MKIWSFNIIKGIKLNLDINYSMCLYSLDKSTSFDRFVRNMICLHFRTRVKLQATFKKIQITLYLFFKYMPQFTFVNFF